MNRNRKFLLSAYTVLAVIWLTAFSVSAAPKIEEVKYKGTGIVNVEFESPVLYNHVKVTAVDGSGRTYSTRILSKTREKLQFRINNYVTNRKYTCRIIGIRRKPCCPWQTIPFRVVIPKTVGGISIKEIEYQHDLREVDFEFHQIVEWKNPRVTITDGTENRVIRVHELENNEIEVLVRKLKKGKVYQYTITGIRRKGHQKYVVLKGKFSA